MPRSRAKPSRSRPSSSGRLSDDKLQALGKRKRSGHADVQLGVAFDRSGSQVKTVAWVPNYAQLLEVEPGSKIPAEQGSTVEFPGPPRQDGSLNEELLTTFIAACEADTSLMSAADWNNLGYANASLSKPRLRQAEDAFTQAIKLAQTRELKERAKRNLAILRGGIRPPLPDVSIRIPDLMFGIKLQKQAIAILGKSIRLPDLMLDPKLQKQAIAESKAAGALYVDQKLRIKIPKQDITKGKIPGIRLLATRELDAFTRQSKGSASSAMRAMGAPKQGKSRK